MATWEDVRARLVEELDTEEQGGELSVVLVRRADGVVREQVVLVRRYAAWGRDLVELRSAFGEAGRYDAAKLLAENLTLPLGAIAVHGRYLVLVHKACLADLTTDGVVFLVDRIGAIADTLESRGGTDTF